MPTLPAFMSPIEAGGGPAGFAGAPRKRVLPNLVMAGQEETNWCWSAVAQAVIAFVNGASPSQEEIATEHARRSGRRPCSPPERKKSLGGACADQGCAGCCNDAHILRIVLDQHGRFRALLSEEAAPSFEQIQAEIDAGRPVPCRIQWLQGGGHFVLVAGWTVGVDGGEYVHVLDPASNEGGKAIVENVMPLSAFADAYRQSGLTGYVNYSYRVR